MRKIIPIALCAYLCCFGVNAAFADNKADVKDTNSKVEQKIDIDQPVETITVEEMEHRLKNDPNDDVLFVKLDKDKVDVYTDTANDRSLRRQIVFGAPTESMIRLYTTNKATAGQISRMLEDYEDGNANINNYRVIMDIDNFKTINDTYGHECGDFVLIGVANLIKQSLRDSDVASRYGGEEFIVLLNDNTNKEEAMLVAERIRAAIDNHDFVYGEKHLHVTISVGVTEFDANTNLVYSPNELVNQADKALYVSKNNGRNMVTCYNPKDN